MTPHTLGETEKGGPYSATAMSQQSKANKNGHSIDRAHHSTWGRGIHYFIHSFIHLSTHSVSPSSQSPDVRSPAGWQCGLMFPAPLGPVICLVQLASLIHVICVPLYRVPNLQDLPKLLLHLGNGRAKGLGNQALSPRAWLCREGLAGN